MSSTDPSTPTELKKAKTSRLSVVVPLLIAIVLVFAVLAFTSTDDSSDATTTPITNGNAPICSITSVDGPVTGTTSDSTVPCDQVGNRVVNKIVWPAGR